MRWKYLIVFICLTCTGFAHPGVGIVTTPEGVIFYTDTKQVWKMTPDGKREVVVAGVHTHELYLSKAGDLYGEHLWYNGTRGTWGHYIWCLRRNGRLNQLTDSTEGFRRNFSFIRNREQQMLWFERGNPDTLRIAYHNGYVENLGLKEFGTVGWQYFDSHANRFLFQADQRIWEYNREGGFKVLSPALHDSREKNASKEAMVMGLWTDASGNIFAAVYSNQCVRKISPDGSLQVVYKSSGNWSPCGGVTTPDGVTYVMEWSTQNDCRVVRVS